MGALVTTPSPLPRSGSRSGTIRECLDGLVATVGKRGDLAGAGNVIAGEARATLDARHADDVIRKEAVQLYGEFAEEAAARRGVHNRSYTSLDQSAVPWTRVLEPCLAGAITAATGRQPRRMTSGAGHDAMIVARRFPLRCCFFAAREASATIQTKPYYPRCSRRDCRGVGVPCAVAR